jgi:hypothetical protein
MAKSAAPARQGGPPFAAPPAPPRVEARIHDHLGRPWQTIGLDTWTVGPNLRDVHPPSGVYLIHVFLDGKIVSTTRAVAPGDVTIPLE